MFEEFMVGVARSISNIRRKSILGAASAAAIVSGLILAFFEVQGWEMPTLLAIVIQVILYLMLLVSLGVVCYEVVFAIRKNLEERATSASWVSKDYPGLLDYEADGKRATERFSKEILKLTENMKKFTTKLMRYTDEFQNLSKPGKIVEGVEKQKKANRVAKDIDRNAVYIEKRAELFDELEKDITRNYEGVIVNIKIHTEEDRKIAQDFLGILVSYEQSASQALNGIKQYRDSVRNVEKLNISRTVRIASGRLGDGLDNLVKTFQNIPKNSKRLQAKLDKTLSSNGAAFHTSDSKTQ